MILVLPQFIRFRPDYKQNTVHADYFDFVLYQRIAVIELISRKSYIYRLYYSAESHRAALQGVALLLPSWLSCWRLVKATGVR